MTAKDGYKVLTVHISPKDQESMELVRLRRQRKYGGKAENDSELIRNLIREELSLLDGVPPGGR